MKQVTDLLKSLEDQDIVVLNDKNRVILQQALAVIIESQEECAVCLEQLSAPVITVSNPSLPCPAIRDDTLHTAPNKC